MKSYMFYTRSYYIMKVSTVPIRGILDAAGGVESAKSSNNTKNATNMLIPTKQSWNDSVSGQAPVRNSTLPISGIDAAAGGVLSVNSNNRRKKATNIFIPTKDEIKH